MIFQQTTFDRLFPAALDHTGNTTSFGFESGGKRYFDVNVPGKPRIEQGMTVIALLEKPDAWGLNGLLGWIDCRDGTIVCNSPRRFLGYTLLCILFVIIYSIRTYIIFSSSVYVDVIAGIIATLFGAFALHFLYHSVKALIVKRALVDVRDFIKLKK